MKRLFNFDDNKKLVTLWEIAIILAYAIILIFFTKEKSGLHMDEVSSYVGANNSYDKSISIKPEFDVKYDDAAEPWMVQMTVSADHRFDYKNIFEIQSHDNHPPFYLMLLHTVSSLFPGKYNKWFAGVINIFFAILTLVLVQLICRYITKDYICTLIVSAFFCISSGIISATTYFRMYLLGMFFVTLITYLLIKNVSKQSIKFYISIAIAVILGVLTHYYIAIYIFFASLAYVITLLCGKKIKAALYYILDMGICAGLYILVYPAALRVMFSGDDRSGQVLDNIKMSFPMMIAKIKNCFSILSKQITSGMLLYILILIALLCVFILVKKKNALHLSNPSWIIPLVGTVGYQIAISVITVYETPRYFYPIYALTLVYIICALYMLMRKLSSKTISVITVVIIFALCSLLSFKENIHYLYRSTRPFLEEAATKGNTDCIFVTEHPYDVNACFLEVKNYNSVTFIHSNELSHIKNADVDVSNGLVVIYTADVTFEMIDNEVTASWPGISETSVTEHSGSYTIYYQ